MAKLRINKSVGILEYNGLSQGVSTVVELMRKINSEMIKTVSIDILIPEVGKHKFENASFLFFGKCENYL